MGTKRGEIKSFFQEDVFENAFGKVLFVLFRPQSVNWDLINMYMARKRIQYMLLMREC